MTREKEVIVSVIQTTEGGRTGILHVWADDISTIQTIEGVAMVLSSLYLPVSVLIDARHNAHVVAANVEDLLYAENLLHSDDNARDSEETK
jgi:acyl-homoserine lactone acylase PvdQ